MSRYDKIRERREKIKSFLSQYGALSTDQLHKLLKDNGIAVNKRTVQRDIEELQVEGVVIANPPVGREQTYSLAKGETTAKPAITPYLLNSIWKETRRISRLAIHGEIGIPEPVKAMREMQFLIASLPKTLKDKIKPLENQIVEKIKDIYEKREEALKHSNHERAGELYSEYESACFHGVKKLIDELSNILYNIEGKSLNKMLEI